MDIGIKRFGDWIKAGVVLKTINVQLKPAFEAQLKEDGELMLKSLLSHIDTQDLPWTPLSQRTIELKNGDDTIYVETGYLRNNLSVRKIRSSSNSLTFFVGASPWKRTKEGVKLSDLMIWLEYGTDRIPARPLIRPTWMEVEPIIKDHWREFLEDLIVGGSI